MDIDELYRRIRKDCSMLFNSGIGVLVVTIWIAVKYSVYVTCAQNNLFDSVYDHIIMNLQIQSETMFYAIMVPWEAILRYIIAFFCIKEGKKAKKAPLWLMIVLILYTAFVIIYNSMEIYYTIVDFSIGSLLYCFLDNFFLCLILQLDYAIVHLRGEYRELRKLTTGEGEQK